MSDDSEESVIMRMEARMLARAESQVAVEVAQLRAQVEELVGAIQNAILTGRWDEGTAILNAALAKHTKGTR